MKSLYRSAFTPITVAFLGLVTVAGPASAQSFDELRDQLRGEAVRRGLGESIQSVNAFAAVPGVSAAKFTVGGSDQTSDADIGKISLPLSYQFSDIGVADGELYTELTLGYMTIDESGEILPNTPQEMTLDIALKSYSLIGGLGLGFPITERTVLRPIALVGYSRLEDEGDLSGPGATVLRPLTDGLLFNFTVDALLYGAALEVEHKRGIGTDLGLLVKLRYNHLFSDTFHASDPALEANSNFGVFTANAEVDGPTGATLLGRELRWIGFAANSTFTESQGTDIDFFFQLGGGIKVLDPTVIRGVQGVSLRVSGLIGEKEVTGYSVSAKLEF